MAKPPGTQAAPLAADAKHRGWILPPARYRHPGDVIRPVIAGLVLAAALVAAVATHGMYAGASASLVTALGPSTIAGRVLAGLVQADFVVAAVTAVAVTLHHRRFRLLACLAAVVASAVLIGSSMSPAGRVLAVGAGEWSWLTGASLAGHALGAAAVAPGWLSWRLLQRREYA